MARWLITRPAEDAADLAAEIVERGHEALVAPVLEVEPITDVAIDLAGVQAVLATSANGVRALARLSTERRLPLLAVGDHTAEAARASGFGNVVSADGAAPELARLARTLHEPAAGALLHATGEQSGPELTQALEAQGFTVRRVVLYRMRVAETLPPAAAAALTAGRIDGAVLLSPRSAEALVRLIAAAGLTERLKQLVALCLSPAVAARLDAAAWRGVRVAERPNREALLALIDDAAPAAPAPLPPRPPEPAAPPAGSGGRWAAIAVLAALAAISAPLWSPRLLEQPDPKVLEGRIVALEMRAATAPPPTVDLSAIEQRLAALEQSAANPELARRLEALEATAVRPLPAPFDPAPLEQRLQALEAALPGGIDATELDRRLAPLEQRLGAAESGVQGELAALRRALDAATARLAAAEAALQSLDAGAIAAQARLFAAGRLADAVESGQPLAPLTAAAAPLFAADPAAAAALDTLTGLAADGVASRARLAADFPAMAAAARGSAPAAGDGWIDQALAEVEELVSVRPAAGEVEGTDAPAVLARAEGRLLGGNLAGAVAALKELEGAPAEPAAGWIAAAERRLQAEQALATLDAAAVAGLAAP